MDINEYINKIKELGACSEAVEQAHKYETSQELWNDCKRGDWMLWLLGKLCGKPESDSRRKIVLTACKCARLALPYAGENKIVALKAIETAEKWANNVEGITIQDVKEAASASAASASFAAYAAASAAHAAYAAFAVSYAAFAAHAAASAAAHAAEREEILQKCADIVREYYPDVDSLWSDK